jgi:hypothetical protein
MPPKSLDDYMNWPGWVPTFEQLPEGGWRVTVGTVLPDFELFAADLAQLEAEWKAGLRTHLNAYLKFQKAILLPDLGAPKTGTTSSNVSPGWTVSLILSRPPERQTATA